MRQLLVATATVLTGCTAIAGLGDFRVERDAGSDDVRDGSQPPADGCVASTFYRDQDGDGAGDDGDTMTACSAPPQHTDTGGDCDDADDTVNPGADEACNGVDDDCDGTLDEGLSPREVYYADSDGDGFGEEGETVQACADPAGFADVAGDCDPTDAAVFPGASESCNGGDDDCDTGIDEGVLGLVGTERTFGAGSSFLTIVSEGSTYWAAFLDGGDPSLAQLDSTGERIGSALTWSDASTVRTVALTLAETPAGPRAVVAWRGSEGVVAAVVDPAAPSASTPIVLGTAEATRASSPHKPSGRWFWWRGSLPEASACASWIPSGIGHRGNSSMKRSPTLGAQDSKAQL